MTTAPDGLRTGGKALWSAIADEHDLEAPQLVQLEEACRQKDRCDDMAGMIDTVEDDKTYLVLISKANETANQMKQLLAALRLPDPQTGKKPQYRGPRGAQKPTVPNGVSSLERARAKKSG